jgi:hypothetical protein
MVRLLIYIHLLFRQFSQLKERSVMYRNTKGFKYSERLMYQILGEKHNKPIIPKRKTVYASNIKVKPFMSNAVMLARLSKKKK